MWSRLWPIRSDLDLPRDTTRASHTSTGLAIFKPTFGLGARCLPHQRLWEPSPNPTQRHRPWDHSFKRNNKVKRIFSLEFWARAVRQTGPHEKGRFSTSTSRDLRSPGRLGRSSRERVVGSFTCLRGDLVIPTPPCQWIYPPKPQEKKDPCTTYEAFVLPVSLQLRIIVSFRSRGPVICHPLSPKGG